jgi:phosphatidylglycerophosphate synthase
MNLPLALTWMRILIIPAFVGVFYLPTHFIGMEGANQIATLIFVLAVQGL